ncbi:hypothetical protein EMIHUDRAFT_106716 [Emiliania huxleyi CCMP1516]|uniref:Amino acid transporter transmembrane domain-containing protein n=2 Tax=Emiliania huxleyi TaxID=2903 RepID=A0A0D3I6A6_EMIH1|nr:hypothetical protein EMIHUDRAFT_106716 [Emiliania huxleyi CCMP1516]EOD06791.1 hypothetical protein EMIHUDRAFT_106716 [Emiliania huxleyi CCMP1516]|eukprot:XP_005759220.1 hypothetical protein EMIHUDRAFT_106716 [Emiliania huxleyi CCMP1516]
MSLAIDRAERDAASAAQLSKRARALAGRIRTSQTHDRLPSAPPPQQQGFTIGAALSLDSWTLAQSSAPGLRVATSPSSLLLAESRGFLVLEPAAEARAAALGDYRQLNAAGAGVKTFEDLAFRSFGLLGRRVLESTVVLLQLGVVTVLSSAACAIDAAPVQVREIASLMPLSLPGNVAILAAVVGASSRARPAPPLMSSVGCAVSLLFAAADGGAAANGTATTLSGGGEGGGEGGAEGGGIALVLPIENALSASAASGSRCFRYEELIVVAMLFVVFLFACALCGLAFPDTGGSIVAYLALLYPSSSAMQLLNAAVAAAAACCASSSFAASAAVRSAIVLGGALVTVVLPDVGLLVALVGAFTTTTIAAFPFLMQLRLAAAGAVPPLGFGRTLMAVWMVAFSGMVMVLGTYTALGAVCGRGEPLE